MRAPEKHNDGHSVEEQKALRTILEGTAAHTGKRFFRELVKHLARALHTRSAWITEYVEEEQKLKALAFWIDEQFVEGYEYEVKGTPCEYVIGKKDMLHIPRNVIRLFPEDHDLASQRAMSYLGTPLLDLDGSVLGNLAVMDSNEMPEKFQNVAIFKIFADRGASELRRLRIEQQLRDREGQLSRLFDSAMDAIIEVDPELVVTQANRAAFDLFEDGDDQKMLGQSFERYLLRDSALKLRNLLQGLHKRPLGKRYLWIPGGLKALGKKGRPFQFEATLSCYEHNRSPYCLLILRNVTERIEAEKRIDVLSAESEYLRQEIEQLHNPDEIIAQSPCMLRVLDEIEKVAATNATVLISGETGTGKELVARAIHAKSKRKDKPLIKVNCASIPETLIESEFFGHEKGAFTGATEQRKGRFALAHGGTIFLDEIGEIPSGLQPKLLRVLQEGEFESVGSSVTQKVDVRVIAATNRNLKEMVREGAFRADLYYRLNVFPLTIPPLRLRGKDILLLAETFIDRYSLESGRLLKSLTEADINRLESYSWPGNVRELKNIIERAVITAQGDRLNLSRVLSGTAEGEEVVASDESAEAILTAEEFSQQERLNMIRALECTDWKVAGPGGAAELIGVPPSTFSSRMKALGITRPGR